MDDAILSSIRLSLQVAFTATLLVVLTGLPLAWLLARRRFRGKELLDVLLTLPLVLPPTVTGYYLVLLFGRHGWLGGPLFAATGWSVVFTWQGAALASYVVALPLLIKTARAAFESVDENLLRASTCCGHSEWSTTLRVLLPLARRGLWAGTALAFARAMGEFGATLMLAGNIPGRTATMPLAIYSLAGSGEWGAAHALVLLMTVLSGLFLYLANRGAGRWL
ncbi:MAG: molybdate ABC transporter permease subunit [Candidatus Delongbacteria bacterium]